MWVERRCVCGEWHGPCMGRSGVEVEGYGVCV